MSEKPFKLPKKEDGDPARDSPSLQTGESPEMAADEAKSLPSSDVLPINIDDLSQFRLPTDYSVTGAVSQQIDNIPVTKPQRHDFFRSHLTYEFTALFLENKTTREHYLIPPKLQVEFRNELVVKVLIPCITMAGNIHLWPIRLADQKGNLDSWNRSAGHAIKAARNGWVRVIANRDVGAYDIIRPRVKIEGPKWPDLSMDDMVLIAFRDHRIDKLDHPALQALRGERITI